MNTASPSQTSSSQPTDVAQASLRSLAMLALGRSGADIERLVREVRQVARREQRTIRWDDIEHALRSGQMPMSDDLRWRVCVHEAGHATAWSQLDIGEVISVAIGTGEMGHVMTRQHAHFPQTQQWLTATMTCLLAGRAAELLIFGDTVAGSGGEEQSDLARATHYAMAAETTLGFSDHQPLVYRGTERSFDMLNFDQDLATRVNDRLANADTMARNLLETHRRGMLDIAGQLRGRGVMEGDEVRRILCLRRKPAE